MSHPFEEIWGASINGGFTSIPNILIEHQRSLGITTTQMCTLVVLMKYLWSSEEKTPPTYDRISASIGITKPTVRRSINRLVELGLLKKTQTAFSINQYDLSGLVDAVQKLSKNLDDDS